MKTGRQRSPALPTCAFFLPASAIFFSRKARSPSTCLVTHESGPLKSRALSNIRLMSAHSSSRLAYSSCSSFLAMVLRSMGFLTMFG